MASNYWLKLYHETLHDPKVTRLSDRLYRRFMECLLMAAEGATERGDLPEIEDAAWTLHTDAAELANELQALASRGLLTIIDQGGYYVTKFTDRQAPVSDAERKQRQRERELKRAYYGTGVTKRAASETAEVHPDVTNRVAESDKNQNRVRGESDESENQKAGATRPAPSLSSSSKPAWTQVLARAGIVVSGTIESEKWADLAEEAGIERFTSAVEIAVEQGKRSLAYVRGVVRHSMAEKRMPGDSPPRASPDSKSKVSRQRTVLDAAWADLERQKQEAMANGNELGGPKS
jgi:hypothetical protein